MCNCLRFVGGLDACGCPQLVCFVDSLRHFWFHVRIGLRTNTKACWANLWRWQLCFCAGVEFFHARLGASGWNPVCWMDLWNDWKASCLNKKSCSDLNFIILQLAAIILGVRWSHNCKWLYGSADRNEQERGTRDQGWKPTKCDRRDELKEFL